MEKNEQSSQQKKSSSVPEQRQLRRQDIALSAAPEPVKSVKSKNIAQTNETLRKLKEECKEK